MIVEFLLKLENKLKNRKRELYLALILLIFVLNALGGIYYVFIPLVTLILITIILLPNLKQKKIQYLYGILLILFFMLGSFLSYHYFADKMDKMLYEITNRLSIYENPKVLSDLQTFFYNLDEYYSHYYILALVFVISLILLYIYIQSEDKLQKLEFKDRIYYNILLSLLFSSAAVFLYEGKSLHISVLFVSLVLSILILKNENGDLDEIINYVSILLGVLIGFLIMIWIYG